MSNFKIVLSGGGTGGSVSPLLAIIEELRQEKDNTFEFLWIGTKDGLEKAMIEREQINFQPICSGKWRRYFSWKNFTDLFLIKIGFWQSVFLMLKFKPDLVISAGGFVSVPVVWAAWLLRIPSIIHQQDVVASLANKLMAPFARIVTVTFEDSLEDFGPKAIWTGNPIRRSLEISGNVESLKFAQEFNIKHDLPILLVVGGGTGAEAINILVAQSMAELTKFCQVIHLTGKSKNTNLQRSERYLPIEFLDVVGMAEVYHLADVVVTRAGMGALTEVSYFGKPSIIIPMPDSHQEANAQIFKQKNAALVFNQNELSSEKFVLNVKNLIERGEERLTLIMNIGKVIKKIANQEMVKIIINLLNK